MTTYAVRIVEFKPDGTEYGMLLDVKGKHEWKTKKIAKAYYEWARDLINRGVAPSHWHACEFLTH